MGKTKRKTSIDYKGLWYVPGMAVKLEGRIVIKKKRYYLLLFTNKTFEDKIITLDDRTIEYLNYPIIIGSGQYILGACTLVNCKWAGIKEIGENLFQLKYEIHFAFSNTLIEDETKLLVNRGIFSFSGLSTWYDGSESIDRLSPHTDIFVNGTEQLPNTQNSSKKVKITDNINFVFIDDFGEHANFGNTRERTFNKYLEIEFNEPVHFKELISAAVHFLNLLEVCLFRKATFSIHRVEFVENGCSYSEYEMYSKPKDSHVLNYSLNRGQKVSDGFLHQNYMLLSGWKFSKAALDDVIRTWFFNRNYSYIYDYFIDSHFWTIDSQLFLTNVMFNNRFLNMLHGVEGFHRLFYGHEEFDNKDFLLKKSATLKLINNPVLKKWVNNSLNPPKHKLKYGSLSSKINHLLDEFEPFLSVRFGSNMIVTRNFFLRSIEYRDMLSHGLQNTTQQGDEFNKLFFAIQYLLALCVLKSLGITTTHNTIVNNVSLNDNANEIIAYINAHFELYATSK